MGILTDTLESTVNVTARFITLYAIYVSFKPRDDDHKSEEWIDIHNFKLVKYGNVFHVNCDLVLPWDTSLADAHREGEKLKKLVTEGFSEDIVFQLHIDECFKNYCSHCPKADCRERTEAFVSPAEFELERFMAEKRED